MSFFNKYKNNKIIKTTLEQQKYINYKEANKNVTPVKQNLK